MICAYLYVDARDRSVPVPEYYLWSLDKLHINTVVEFQPKPPVPLKLNTGKTSIMKPCCMREREKWGGGGNGAENKGKRGR